jgi:hypothetical protein
MVAMNFVFSLFFTMTGIIRGFTRQKFSPLKSAPAEIRSQRSPIGVSILSSRRGFRFFYAFFVFNICAALCYVFFFPETKGKTLEQMDQLFGDQVVPHALQEPEAAQEVMEKRFSIPTHVERVPSV